MVNIKTVPSPYKYLVSISVVIIESSNYVIFCRRGKWDSEVK